MNNSMNNYVIKISCTSKDELCYNNKKISIKNYNKLNFDKLLDTIEYIKKVLILYKKYKDKSNQIFTTKSLEFICKCNNESTIDLKTFIKAMQTLGFSSITDNFIHLIKINTNAITEQYEPILKYRFQSITEAPLTEYIKRKNNSMYHIEILYTKT